MHAETPEMLRPAVTSPEADPPPGRRACVVRLGGQPFAVDVADAREVVVLGARTPVPGAPAPVVGVMNLRGGVLTLVEARPLLGLPVRPGAERALVLADGNHRAGVLIEQVLGLTALDAVRPLAEPDGAGLAVGHLTSEAGARATLLDARAVLVALRRSWAPAPGGPR